jgi:hypothetical protein
MHYAFIPLTHGCFKLRHSYLRRWDEAEQLLAQVMGTFKQPGADPDTLMSMVNPTFPWINQNLSSTKILLEWETEKLNINF